MQKLHKGLTRNSYGGVGASAKRKHYSGIGALFGNRSLEHQALACSHSGVKEVTRPGVEELARELNYMHGPTQIRIHLPMPYGAFAISLLHAPEVSSDPRAETFHLRISMKVTSVAFETRVAYSWVKQASTSGGRTRRKLALSNGSKRDREHQARRRLTQAGGGAVVSKYISDSNSLESLAACLDGGPYWRHRPSRRNQMRYPNQAPRLRRRRAIGPDSRRAGEGRRTSDRLPRRCRAHHPRAGASVAAKSLR